MKTLYVGNVSYHATRDMLIDLFSQCGEVMGIALPFDYRLKQHRGFAFVEFETPSEASRAMFRFNGYFFMKRQLTIRMTDKQIVER